MMTITRKRNELIQEKKAASPTMQRIINTRSESVGAPVNLRSFSSMISAFHFWNVKSSKSGYELRV